MQVKGKTEPLALFRPLRARARFGSDVTRTHATPLVGRELEKPLLIGTFERSAQQRSCQLVTIVGEPGVGKSRLCAELFGYIEDRPGLVTLAAGALPPLRGGHRLLGAGGDREGRVRHPRVRLARGGGGQARARPARRTIPTAPGSRPASPRSSARAASPPPRRSPSPPGGASWSRWRSGGQTVLVFEDLHWADPALLSFLEHLADWSRERAAPPALHRPPGAPRAASDLGGRAAQRDHDQPRPADRRGHRPPALARCSSARCCPPRRSARCSSGRAATPSTRRSSCACSQTATCSRGRSRTSSFPTRCRR